MHMGLGFVFYWFILFIQAPKNLMTLNKILDEYISLKNHKVMKDHELFVIEQEKNRNLMVFQGMNNVVTAYLAGGNCSPPAAKSTLEVVSQPRISNKSYPGISYMIVNSISFSNILHMQLLCSSNFKLIFF